MNSKQEKFLKFVSKVGCQAHCANITCPKSGNYFECMEAADGLAFTSNRKVQCEPKVPVFYGKTYGYLVQLACKEKDDKALLRNKLLLTAFCCIGGVLYLYSISRLFKACRAVRDHRSRAK